MDVCIGQVGHKTRLLLHPLFSEFSAEDLDQSMDDDDITSRVTELKSPFQTFRIAKELGIPSIRNGSGWFGEDPFRPELVRACDRSDKVIPLNKLCWLFD